MPLQPCRRHGKKRGKEEESNDNEKIKKEPSSQPQGNPPRSLANMSSLQSSSYGQSLSSLPAANSGMSLEMAMEAMEAQLQSSQVMAMAC